MTLDSKLKLLSKWSSWFLVAAGVCITLGWQFQIPWLKGQMFGTFVAPNTALSFVLTGASVLLQLSHRGFLQKAGLVLGIFVTLFAVATGAEYLFSVDLHIDRIFMAHRMSDWFLPLPGRYTTNSVFGFFCAGVSLLFLRKKPGVVSEAFALMVLLVSYLSCIALVFGASALIDHVMAAHTAVLFAFAGVALLFSNADPYFIKSVTSPFAGAVASRWMILSVIVLIPVISGLELWSERVGLLPLRLGSALSTIASVTLFTILAIRIAMVLNETDRQRVEGEAALLKSMQLAAAGRMAASIAHEVNNPLESVTNLLFLLKNDGLPDETRKAYLEIAEREITRVAAIARRTLGFYRDDSKESLLDLNSVVEATLDLYREKLTSPINLERNFSPNVCIRAKLGEVRQVLANLVANAIDALRPRGGTLVVQTRLEGNSAVVTVSDTGCGISAENLKNIYEPFYTTKHHTGTGLGLWITRELVVRNGGTITVRSSTGEEDHGTRFEIAFPVAAGTQEPQVTSAQNQG